MCTRDLAQRTLDGRGRERRKGEIIGPRDAYTGSHETGWETRCPSLQIQPSWQLVRKTGQRSCGLQQLSSKLLVRSRAIQMLSGGSAIPETELKSQAVIQIRDTATWASVATVEEKAWLLAWSSDGRLFAGCIDGTIKIYDPSTGMLHTACSRHSDAVFSIAFSHNTKFFATASWDKTIRLWEAMTFQQVGPNLRHNARAHSISILPDDSHLVSGARVPNIRVWNLRNLAPNLFKDFPLEPNRGPVCSPCLSVYHILNLTLLYDKRRVRLSSRFQTGVYGSGAVAILMYLLRASIQWVILISLC